MGKKVPHWQFCPEPFYIKGFIKSYTTDTIIFLALSHNPFCIPRVL